MMPRKYCDENMSFYPLLLLGKRSILSSGTASRHGDITGTQPFKVNHNLAFCFYARKQDRQQANNSILLLALQILRES